MSVKVYKKTIKATVKPLEKFQWNLVFEIFSGTLI